MEGISYVVVYPDLSRKYEFLNNYVKRSDSQDFIKLLDLNWESWINEIEDNESNKIKLSSGEFMEDIIKINVNG